MMAFPSEYVGVWQRVVLEEPIGTRIDTDGETKVFWLQSPSGIFTDIRIPVVNETTLPKEPLSALDESHLSLLAKNKSFAGHTTVEGTVLTWHRDIDFQPLLPGAVDIGKMLPSGIPNIVLEDGIDDDYREHWLHVDDGASGTFALVLKSTVLRNGQTLSADAVRGFFVGVGNHFLRVLGRSATLPAGIQRIADLCDRSKHDRASLEAALSMDSRYGHVTGTNGKRFAVVHSTLPWASGASLLDGASFSLSEDRTTVVETVRGDAEGEVVASRTWEVAEMSLSLAGAFT